ncbi:hypothetical protein P7C70_g6312, partial [Phenoliferia sp. Uapishka_3]
MSNAIPNKLELSGLASIWALIDGVKADVYGIEVDVDKRTATGWIASCEGARLEIGASVDFDSDIFCVAYAACPLISPVHRTRETRTRWDSKTESVGLYTGVYEFELENGNSHKSKCCRQASLIFKANKLFEESAAAPSAGSIQVVFNTRAPILCQYSCVDIKQPHHISYGPWKASAFTGGYDFAGQARGKPVDLTLYYLPEELLRNKFPIEGPFSKTSNLAPVVDAAELMSSDNISINSDGDGDATTTDVSSLQDFLSTSAPDPAPTTFSAANIISPSDLDRDNARLDAEILTMEQATSAVRTALEEKHKKNKSPFPIRPDSPPLASTNFSRPSSPTKPVVAPLQISTRPSPQKSSLHRRRSRSVASFWDIAKERNEDGDGEDHPKLERKAAFRATRRANSQSPIRRSRSEESCESGSSTEEDSQSFEKLTALPDVRWNKGLGISGTTSPISTRSPAIPRPTSVSENIPAPASNCLAQSLSTRVHPSTSSYGSLSQSVSRPPATSASGHTRTPSLLSKKWPPVSTSSSGFPFPSHSSPSSNSRPLPTPPSPSRSQSLRSVSSVSSISSSFSSSPFIPSVVIPPFAKSSRATPTPPGTPRGQQKCSGCSESLEISDRILFLGGSGLRFHKECFVCKSGIEFQVHKSRLAFASEVFSDMLEVGSTKSMEVTLVEPATVLARLLPFAYPEVIPPLRLVLPEDMDLLKALKKYELSRGIESMAHSLKLYLIKRPSTIESIFLAVSVAKLLGEGFDQLVEECVFQLLGLTGGKSSSELKQLLSSSVSAHSDLETLATELYQGIIEFKFDRHTILENAYDPNTRFKNCPNTVAMDAWWHGAEALNSQEELEDYADTWLEFHYKPHVTPGSGWCYCRGNAPSSQMRDAAILVGELRILLSRGIESVAHPLQFVQVHYVIDSLLMLSSRSYLFQASSTRLFEFKTLDLAVLATELAAELGAGFSNLLSQCAHTVLKLARGMTSARIKEMLLSVPGVNSGFALELFRGIVDYTFDIQTILRNSNDHSGVFASCPNKHAIDLWWYRAQMFDWEQSLTTFANCVPEYAHHEMADDNGYPCGCNVVRQIKRMQSAAKAIGNLNVLVRLQKTAG